MGSYRKDRINEEMTRSVAEIVRGVKDWRLRNCVVSITGVNCAPDLSNAKIFYSYIGKGNDKDVSDGLKNATGYIRGQLAKTLNLRQTPTLTFVYDNSIENGAHINKLLDNITYSDDADEKKDETDE